MTILTIWEHAQGVQSFTPSVGHFADKDAFAKWLTAAEGKNAICWGHEVAVVDFPSMPRRMYEFRRIEVVE